MDVLTPEQPKRSADFIGSTLDIGLRMSHLRKAFRSPAGAAIEVLRDVSFSVSGGEIVAVMGASGAGKSTLLHLLGGLEAADGGSIQLGSSNAGKAQPKAPSHFPNDRAGFVFQRHYLLADLTAVENVALPLMIARQDRGDNMQRAAHALEAIGLGGRLAHRIGYLS